jgi:hypothetical protein
MRALMMVAALVAASCTNYPPTYPSTVPSTTPITPGTPGATTADLIEYRITGTPAQVNVRFSTSFDGSTQLLAALPWSVNLSTTRAPVFLSVEATPVSAFSLLGPTPPFLTVQIFINGILFREASSANFSTTLTVSGTWRRGNV